jgi:hypothetical protein
MQRVHVVLAIQAVLFAVAAAPAGGQTLPDIEPSVPYDVNVVQRDGRWFLGFATAARNVGPGALRIQGQGDGSGVMLARQLSEDGAQVLNPSVGILRYVSTPTHQHWHYLDFMRYELRGVDHRNVLRDQKQGFCLGDAPFVPNWCSSNAPAATVTDIGLRPAGVEIYSRNIEGQEIAIDPEAAPAGRYVLSARIGPTGVLRETRTDNNNASALIKLTWPTTDPAQQPEPRPVATIKTCVRERCTWRLPARSASVARRLAAKALRRTFGRLASRGVRATCRLWRARAHACQVRVRRERLRFRGSVRVWYVVDTAAGRRWYYTVKGIRRTRGCRAPESRCVRRIRRAERLGGKVASRARTSTARASATSIVCRLAMMRA